MKRWQLYIPALTLEALLIFGCIMASELKTSNLQALFFSTVDEQLAYEVQPGPSSRIRFPVIGPFDNRLGYTKIAAATKSLLHHGFRVHSQARISPRMEQLVDLGVFPIYDEKTVAGLKLLDRRDQVIYQVSRPERTFPSFEAIPSVIVDTLLFIENREILDLQFPNKNPAVEWDRLGKAVLEKAVQEIYPEHSAPGGSTLATQLEKFRHGYEGRTRTAHDKLQQMISASFRAYLDGPVTSERRRGIVLDYINSIPLAALPGYGEVSGLGDGLWAWYGSDVKDVTRLLLSAEHGIPPGTEKEVATAFKQVLSLFIAHRRPSSFLLTDVQILNGLTDDYLQLLASHGVISPELRDRAQEVDLHLRSSAPAPEAISFLDRKAANAIRTQLLGYLPFPKLYDLDQTDLTVHTSIDRDAQDRVTNTLRELRTREKAQELGLASGEHSLSKGDPAKVIYSVTLYEHVKGRNLLRIQTDNYDRPFSINEGTKLDLGSTAKLRVLTNYLQIVDELHDRYSGAKAADLKAARQKVTDPISSWAIEFLQANPTASLKDMLDAAVARQYSANPGEQFFTGGGLHSFVNFKKEDNGKNPSIGEAIRHSINLPFIRLMRDVVRFYMAQIPGSPTRATDAANEEARKTYLAKFADKEGTYFLEQFYQKYRKLSEEELLPFLLRDIKPTPVRLSVVYRYLYPGKSLQDFTDFLSSWLPMSSISSETAASLYEKYGPGKYPLGDIGYLARVHPLELWLVGYLAKTTERSFEAVKAASVQERQDVYQWLFKTRSRHAQDVRIRTLVENEAFLEIHRAWKGLGYPFDRLVPSYATAIGSSGDRPAALAELVGIIMNDGVKYPSVRISALEFAQGTPYETNFKARSGDGERVLKSEVAAKLREALTDVVQNGTARRVNGAFVDKEGQPITIGGKTGTGDHRYETYGKGGQLISSRVVNRTATFAFFIGDRFFGVVSAHVQGEQAAKYDFTSALAAGLLKALAPALTPIIHEEPESNLRHPLYYPGALSCMEYGTLPPLSMQFLRELKHYEKKPLPTAEPKPSPTPTAKPAQTPAAKSSPSTPRPKQTETPKATPTATAKASSAATPTPSATVSATAAEKATSSATSETAPKPTTTSAVPQPSRTPTPQETPPQAERTATPRPSATAKPKSIPTSTPKPASSATSSNTKTPSPAASATPKPTSTATKKPTAAPTAKSKAPSAKSTASPAPKKSASPKPSATPKKKQPEPAKTKSPEPTPSGKPSVSPRPSATPPATESTADSPKPAQP